MYSQRLLVAATAAKVFSKFSGSSSIPVAVHVLPVQNNGHCRCCHKHSTRTAARQQLHDRMRLTLFSKAGISLRCSMWNAESLRASNIAQVHTRSYFPWRMKDPVPDLQRFLSEIGTDPREGRFWLKQFLNVDQKKPFAVVEVDPDIFADSAQLDSLASAVSFLQRNCLRPVLVLGDALSSHATGCKSLQEQQAAATVKSCALSDALNEQGLESCILFPGSGIIEVECSDSSSGAKVKHVRPALIEWCMMQKNVPIIPSFGETATGQIVQLHMWDVTSAVARQLHPLKVIKVNCHGGFQDEKQQVIVNINIPFDFQAAEGKSWCTESVVQTIREVNSLLGQVPEHMSVVITAADKMLQELFTHHGSGTFLKVTERILKYNSLEEVDIDKLSALLTKSFKRSLSETYFDDIKDLIHTIYLSERYSAAAVILHIADCDVPYLCKIAVSAQAQGEGTGDILWEAIRRDFRQLFWRSRGSNPINPWYFRKSEGSWSDATWTVFWYGIPEPFLSNALISIAVSIPESFPLPDPSKQPNAAKS